MEKQDFKGTRSTTGVVSRVGDFHMHFGFPFTVTKMKNQRRDAEYAERAPYGIGSLNHWVIGQLCEARLTGRLLMDRRTGGQACDAPGRFAK